MKDTIKEVCLGLALTLYMVALGLCFYVVVYGVKHPDLPELQFIAANYGRVWAAVACTLAGYGLTSFAEGIGAHP